MDRRRSFRGGRIWILALLMLVGPVGVTWIHPAATLPADKGESKKKEKSTKDAKKLPAGWYSNYDEALAKAKKTGQPLLVLFH